MEARDGRAAAAYASSCSICAMRALVASSSADMVFVKDLEVLCVVIKNNLFSCCQ